MPSKKIEIRGKKYELLPVEQMKRKQVRKLAATVKALTTDQEDPEIMDKGYDLLSVVVPSLSDKVLDDLTLGEVMGILEGAGILGTLAVDGDSEAISVGESSASTSS